jgi:hypothetical protein
MSHFTTIKTQLADAECLRRALRDLGCRYAEGQLEVRDYSGNRVPVEICVPTKSKDYAIGFRKVGDTYQCVADWASVRGRKQESFIQQVTQRYAYHATRASLEAQGFAVAAEETLKDGRIHLVLRRMA